MVTLPYTTDWWPDLSDRRVVIMASGPSMSREQAKFVGEAMERLPQLFVCAINETWRLLPKAHMLYGCDWPWWRYKAPRKEAFSGMRVLGTVPGNGHFPLDMHWQVPLLKRLKIRHGCYEMLWEGDELGAGGNSAFQICEFLVRCGAKDLILLGVDCHSRGLRWHGVHDHPDQPGDSSDDLMRKWREAWSRAKPALDARGVSVVNCSPGSAVDCFRRVPLEVVLGMETSCA